MRSSRWVPGGVAARVITVAAATVLAAACSGAVAPTTVPTTVTPSSSAEPSGASPSGGPPSGGPPSAAASPGAWEGAGTMVWPRHSPVVVRLADGRVLAVGEGSERGVVVSERSDLAEVWDPATGEWHQVEALNKLRGGPAVVALPAGGALVAGGLNEDGQSYSSAYVFDAAGETWIKTGLMGSARTAPAAAVLPDGRVLVAGGSYCTGFDFEASGVALAAWTADVDPGLQCRALATAELFDPTTGEWTETGPMAYARAGASAAGLPNGRVLVWGSAEGLGAVAVGAVTGGELYDPEMGRFSPAAPLPAVDRAALQRLGVPLPPGDPGPAGGAWPGGSLVPLEGDGGVLLVGATSEWGPLSISAIYRYAPAADAWTQVGDPWVTSWEDVNGESVTNSWGTPPPSGFAVGLADGMALFGGGLVEEPRGFLVGTRDAAVLEPFTGTWSAVPDMPSARQSATPVLLADGSVLIVGGYSDGGDGNPVPLGDTFRFVPG